MKVIKSKIKARNYFAYDDFEHDNYYDMILFVKETFIIWMV